MGHYIILAGLAFTAWYPMAIEERIIIGAAHGFVCVLVYFYKPLT